MYYKVSVTEMVDVQLPKGGIKQKKLRFTYLVEAGSVSEAEALCTKFIGMGEFEVKAVRQEKIEAVILKEKK